MTPAASGISPMAIAPSDASAISEFSSNMRPAAMPRTAPRRTRQPATAYDKISATFHTTAAPGNAPHVLTVIPTARSPSARMISLGDV